MFQKKVSLGAFLKRGEDFKDGDLVEIANEGKKQEGQFGMQDIFLVKLSDGREGNVNFNQTSINAIIDAYGPDSIKWIGKTVKVWAILSNVKGKMIKVYYFSHPDATLSDDGAFILSIQGGEKTDEVKEVDKGEIPIIEQDEEVAVEDIPF